MRVGRVDLHVEPLAFRVECACHERGPSILGLGPTYGPERTDYRWWKNSKMSRWGSIEFARESGKLGGDRAVRVGQFFSLGIESLVETPLTDVSGPERIEKWIFGLSLPISFLTV
ncbi:hypothetical protein [Pyrobaculum sp.]|uniref:hypothetical protein n=1 Tax=Pyrobaculum sp. TaxID=2004705 RepID=UPI003D0FF47F